MLTDFIRRLTAPDPAPLSDPDARLALTALLVRIARTDGDYARTEISLIDAISRSRYGLSADAAKELRAQAEEIEADAPDTVRFTRAIKDAVPYEQRIGVIEALWSVVMADGERDEGEDAILRMVAPLLGVEDADSNRARLRIEASLKP